MNSETFLAFKHNENRADRAAGRTVELEVGINYDLAGEIDQRNDWLEPGDVLTKREEALELCKVQAAVGLNELFRFCFEKPLTRRGTRQAVVRFFALAQAFGAPMYSNWFGKNGVRSPIGKRLGACATARLLRVKPHELRRSYAQFRKRWTFRAIVRPVRRSKHALRRLAR